MSTFNYYIENASGSRRVYETIETTATYSSPRYTLSSRYEPISTQTYQPITTELISDVYVKRSVSPRISVTRSISPRNVQNRIYYSKSPIRQTEYIYTSQPTVYTFEYPTYRYRMPLSGETIRTSYRSTNLKNSENLSNIDETPETMNNLEVENPKNNQKLQDTSCKYLEPELKAPKYTSEDVNITDGIDTCVSEYVESINFDKIKQKIERERCGNKSKFNASLRDSQNFRNSARDDRKNVFGKSLNNYLRSNTMEVCLIEKTNHEIIDFQRKEEILRELAKESSLIKCDV